MPEVPVKTKYYIFDQNNSGGSFDIDPKEGIGPRVWVEATSYDHANDRAENIGIYFEGVQEGRDCPCCGDRWHPLWNEEDGQDDPLIRPEYDFNWHDEVYVHRMTGEILTVRKGDVPTESRR